MYTFSLAEAKAQLSKLIELVEDGEQVTITKHGKAVVKLVKSAPPRQQRYVDTSVSMAFLLPESGSELAERLMTSHGDALAFSSWTEVAAFCLGHTGAAQVNQPQ